MFIGIASDDTKADADFIIRRILDVRLFPDLEPGQTADSARQARWAKSVAELSAEVLLVSQFTLHAVFKSNRSLSFHRSMVPNEAECLFYDLCESMRAAHQAPHLVKNCVFGSYMNVALVNDGPVTVLVDSKHPKG